MFIRWMADIGAEDRRSVGGKAAMLGEVAKLGLQTPLGFVVTVESYKQCLLESKGTGLLGSASGRPSLSSSQLVANAVRNGLARLVAQASWPAVAVRSSGVAEDSPRASFAGQFASFLNVRGYDEVASRVEQCWAALCDPGLLQYARRMHIPSSSMEMAVLIQRMIPAEVSGVLFTADPIGGDSRRFVIEAGWGLGNSIVSGAQTPDVYTLTVDGATIGVESEVIDKMGVMSVCATNSSGIRTLPIASDRQHARTLTPRQLHKLARFGQILTRHFGIPQDIEWAWYKGQCYILQTRPITIPSRR